MLEMIKRYQKEIIEESEGIIPDPVRQAVVIPADDILYILRDEYGEQIMDANDYFITHIKDDTKSYEEFWDSFDDGELQEEFANYTFMDIYYIEMDGERYAVGNIDYLKDETILEYAEWYNKDYYEEVA